MVNTDLPDRHCEEDISVSWVKYIPLKQARHITLLTPNGTCWFCSHEIFLRLLCIRFVLTPYK